MFRRLMAVLAVIATLGLIGAAPAAAVTNYDSAFQQLPMPGNKDAFGRVTYRIDSAGRIYPYSATVDCRSGVGVCAETARVDITVLWDGPNGVVNGGTSRPTFQCGRDPGTRVIDQSYLTRAPAGKHIKVVFTQHKCSSTDKATVTFNSSDPLTRRES